MRIPFLTILLIVATSDPLFFFTREPSVVLVDLLQFRIVLCICRTAPRWFVSCVVFMSLVSLCRRPSRTDLPFPASSSVRANLVI